MGLAGVAFCSQFQPTACPTSSDFLRGEARSLEQNKSFIETVLSMHWALRAILHSDLDKLNDSISDESKLEKTAPTTWRVQGWQEDFVLVIEHKRA